MNDVTESILDKSVVVIGDGPAGTATALALRAHNVEVVLLGRKRQSTFVVGEHLAPKASNSLARLGLRDILAADHLSSPGVVSYWGGSLYEKDYIFDPYGCGWNLDRAAFDLSLVDAARSRGAQVIEVRSIESIARRVGGWHVRAKTATGTMQLNAGFVVDATGRSASLTRRLSQTPSPIDSLVAFCGRAPIAQTNTSQPDLRLLLEPMFDGWWYSLVTPGGFLTAVYLTDADFHPPGTAAARQVWHQRLRESEVTQARIAGAPQLETFRVASARTQLSPAVAGEAWLTIGDACMSLDPLASRGLTKALADSILASDVVVAALNGRQAPVTEYVRARKSEFAEYLTDRRNYYQQEQRWPNSSFWKRRHVAVKIDEHPVF